MTTWRYFGALGAVVAVVATTVTGVGASAASAAVSVTLTGGGYGHGVGMSQWGAKGHADAGHDAARTLSAYYPGTTLESRSLSGPRVKLGDVVSTGFTQSGGSVTIGTDGGATALTAGGSNTLNVWADGTTVRASVDGGGSVAVATGDQAAVVGFQSGKSVTVSGLSRSYQWGSIKVRARVSGQLELVLEGITMAQYVRGIAEVPSSWPAEALKAQAIAARSYAAYRLDHPQSSRFDIYASTSDQVYSGATAEARSAWAAAADATDGQVLTYGGSVIQAFYSASNGGYTEDSGVPWSTSYPYLPAAADPFDAAVGNPSASWTRTYSSDEIRAALAKVGKADPGEVQSFSIGGKVSSSARVNRATITIVGSTSTVTVGGYSFFSGINAVMPANRDLLSTRFWVGTGGGNSGGGGGTGEVTQSKPVGALVLSLGVSGNRAFVVGWAGDPDDPSVPVDVAIVVNGTIVTRLTANIDRPDQTPFTEGAGTAHWYAALPVAAGQAKVCAIAIDVGPPGVSASAGSTSLGCLTTTRTATAKKSTKKSSKKAATARTTKSSKATTSKTTGSKATGSSATKSSKR